MALNTPDREPGLNSICEGYKSFFQHSHSLMKVMADLIRKR